MDAINILGYQITEQLYAGTRTLVYRGIRTSDKYPVVIKILRNEYPNFNELIGFRNQYIIAKNLDFPSIIKPLSLEVYQNSYALVMEDFGGISLSTYLKAEIEENQPSHSLYLAEFLNIGLQLADILDYLYQNRVIHKDIKPANILINPETKKVKLIDFSISSLLPRETQEIHNAHALEGTLAYLSPEQTGRMNRGIDYRSDFYSLGITFYELLTGKLPFISEDAMELVHCHLAKQSMQIHQIQPKIPLILSQIVSKLMTKNPENRYQTALGLKHDLEICLAQLQATGAIASFELGKRDITDRLLIAEKLYGREAEVETILKAFDRVSNGNTEIILVAGFSGIGKTAVVNEVHKPIARQRGYFIKGKYDQFQRNIPFSAFVQAFRDLMEQLLSESDCQLSDWKAKILEAVGDNGQVLIDVIPELELIIDAQPAAAELSGSAAQNRFNLLIHKFVKVFTNQTHPLVMFIDDLQWADSASLNLLKLLMQDTQYLLVLGAYRDNEVSPAHPFMLTVDEIGKSGAMVKTITLQPLSLLDMNRLVADTLACELSLAQPLTELVYQKTKGNPFFATQFLKALYENGQITFHLTKGGREGGWQCDIAQLKALALTDDVVEFMALQLQKLPAETQNVLKLAACIGAHFDLNTLAIVSEKSPEATADDLWKALQEGLIIPNTEIYKFFIQSDITSVSDAVANPTYRFLHDRVQQAAYSLIDREHKQATHLCIGMLLLENLSASEREERLFEIVNHFNIGKTLITQPSQREELAQLNFLAGCKAKTSTAYAAALTYIKVAIALLPVDCFEKHYALSFGLYKERAEIEYLNGNLDDAETWIGYTLEKAKTPLKKADVYNMSIIQYTLQAKYPEAIQAGRQALALIDINLPEENLDEVLNTELSFFTDLLKNSSFELLSDLPIMTQPDRKMAIKLLISMGPPTYRSHQRLWSVICAKAVNLCLQYGNTPEIGYIYPAFGGLRGYAMNNYQGTDKLLEITLQLIQGFNNKSAESVAYLMIGSSLRHWSHPLKVATEDYLSSYRVGLESSNLQYAAYAFGHNMYCRFYQSVHLDRLFEEITESLNFSRKHKNQWAIDLLLGGQAIVSELIETQCDYLDPAYRRSENEYLELCRIHKNSQVICIFNILKTQVLFFFDRFEEALDYGRQADAEIINVAPQGLLPYAHHLFIYALLLTSLYPNLLNSHKLDYWEKISTYQKQLEIWAQNCPDNFLHLCFLVKAEVARISDNYLEAIALYDRAIALAKENEYLQEEALANELAAKFYLNWGKEKIAQVYMIEAYYCYARWGAKAKVFDLEIRYRQLLGPILQQPKISFSALETLSSITNSSTQISGSNIGNTLDFASVIQATQALSGTIELDQLLQQLTQIILKNSGADKCVLVLPQDGTWHVRAIATPEVTELCSVPLDDHPNVPIKLIQYVKRMQSVITIDNLQTNLPVIGDYLIQRQPKSVLCLPILNQGHLVGILYLKNQSTAGVFTSDRLTIIEFLCTQAAISLENARLYKRSQDYSQQLEQSLQQQETLFNVVANMRQSLDLPSIFRSITQEARAVLKADRVMVYRFDLDSAYNDGEIVAEDVLPAFPSALAARVQDHCFGENYVNLYQQGKIYAMDDLYAMNYQDCYRVILEQFQVRASLVAPILKNETLWGLLCIHQCSQPRHWNSSDVQFSQRVCAQLSIAVAQADLLGHTHLQAIELTKMLQKLQHAQIQIVQSEKMSALGNLVAGVAHEINNPIGFLSGNIQPALDYINDLFGLIDLYQQKYPQLDPEVKAEIEAIDLDYIREDLPKLVGSMREGVKRIWQISTSLRTFSRADTDHPVACNIHDGIDSTIMILKHRLKANETRPEIAVIKDYGDLPQVACYAGQLNQVFMNLLANAIDALDESNQDRTFTDIQASPNLITIKTELSPDQQAVIRIQDNAKGMNEEVQSKIFEHLFTTKSVGQGTGLGLAIARQIVEDKHRGSIHVNSQLGHGTEFIIILPIKTEKVS